VAGIAVSDLKGIVEGFLLLAVVKALVEPLARRWGRRRIDAIASLFYQLADREVRSMMANGGTAQQLRDATRKRLEALTGEEWSDATLQPLWQGWDPGVFVDRLREET